MNLKTALEIRTKIKDVEGAAETHEKLGYVYLFKKLYGKAREHYGAAMELRIELDQLPAAAANYAQKNDYPQDNLKGRVSKTWNANNRSWFSYDYGKIYDLV